MPVYENVPLVELEQELLTYQSCWGTLVFSGVAIKEGQNFVPFAVQIWATDENDEKTQIYRSPTLPDNLQMFTVARRAASGIELIRQIFAGQLIKLNDLEMSFQHCRFGRAAFLGSNDYDYLYPKELHQNVNGWPKLFFEGSFENRNSLERTCQKLNQELTNAKYRFHTLWDASNHLIGFRTGGGYFMGAIAAALKIPVKLNASIEDRKLSCSFELPKALEGLSRRIWYVARSDKGDRDEEVPIPTGTKENGLINFTSSVHVNPGDEVVEVVLAINQRRLDSARIPSITPAPAETEPERQREGVARRQGKVFIVHGRNHPIRDNIKSYLENEWHLPTEVMELGASRGKTLTEKFEDIASRCRFAIVILSADDHLWLLPKVRKIRRARQNVILELGFFWGRLRRENLAFLVDPSVELPSDIANVSYIPITRDLAQTKLDLIKELKAAGLV